MKTKRIETKWELRTYEVWGSARGGFDVNDVYSAGEATLRIPVEVYNEGTPLEFEAASPTDRQIAALFATPRTKIETEGNDITIYVIRARDGYPLGEMRCLSHDRLSPIREKTEGEQRRKCHDV